MRARMMKLPSLVLAIAGRLEPINLASGKVKSLALKVSALAARSISVLPRGWPGIANW